MATLYCDCDHSVWSDLWWTEDGPFLIFMDNQSSSPSYGKQVTSCPGCGRALKLEALRSEDYPVGS
ncbi:hypothetical protein BH24ACT21_BH24ACT21_16690 [soil metagenome]